MIHNTLHIWSDRDDSRYGRCPQQNHVRAIRVRNSHGDGAIWEIDKISASKLVMSKHAERSAYEWLSHKLEVDRTIPSIESLK